MNYTTFYYYIMSNLEGGGEYQHEGDRNLDSRSPGIYCYLFLYIICGVEWVWFVIYFAFQSCMPPLYRSLILHSQLWGDFRYLFINPFRTRDF